MAEKQKYKDIVVSFIDNNIVVLYLADSNITSVGSAISGFAVFVEYIGYVKPLYVIIDKRGSYLHDISLISDYLKNQVLDEIYSYGVKGIFYIVCTERYLQLKDKTEQLGIRVFLTYEGVFKEIEESFNRGNNILPEK